MARATERQVADWLLSLGKLIAPSMQPEEIRTRINALVPELVQRYSSAEFDSTSREHVARQCKFYPSYGELCDALDSLPSRAPVAVALPDAVTGMDAMDRAWLAFWYRRLDEIKASPGPFGWGNSVDEVANLSSLVQQQSRRAWAIICPESVVIHDRPTDRQVVEVARKLRMLGGPLAGRPMPKDERKPKPSHASPEQLRAIREARGINVPEMSADDVYGEVPA